VEVQFTQVNSIAHPKREGKPGGRFVTILKHKRSLQDDPASIRDMQILKTETNVGKT
jgi:hypothetical protein